MIPKKPANIKQTDYSGYGIQVSKDGILTLNGKPYYGFGVNFFPAFSLCLDRVFFKDTRSDLEAHFKRLSEEGIPCIRVMLGVFYGEYVYLYADKENFSHYITAMDYLISLAEQYRIGIIASLFWNVNAFNDYYKEPLDLIAVSDSKSTKLRLQYIRDIVGRYKYSPAIWAWEIGNELNLAAEMPDTEFTASDGKKTPFRTQFLTGYYQMIGKAIRSEDPYRMITGGDAAPRTYSMALFKSCGKDTSPENTYEENKTAFSWYTPSPLNTISLHYPELRLMKDYVKIAKELKIGLYVGEFHGTLFENPLDTLTPEESIDEAQEQATWYEMRNTYMACGVQLVTSWCYGSYSQAKNIDPASLELGAADNVVQNYYQCKGIKEANSIYLRDGKADTPAYWLRALNSIFF